ncbi:hypothetical protein [Candidatus Uabimicrobium sp. HlEnr_7]|uniref:hypothetical protein n=1 Tax=Candidatus Uabimicrobium helgolandensis TaxID=3095367 RepID=UPI003557ED00
MVSDNKELEKKMQKLIVRLEEQLEKSKKLDEAIRHTLESLKNGTMEIPKL